MRFYETILASAALVAAALALEINDFPATITAGSTATVEYSPKDDTPTTFILRRGDDQNDLTNVTTLTTSATGGSAVLNIPSDLENDDNYALTILQGDVSNFWGPFEVEGGVDESSSSSSASASATSSAAESTSASITTTASASVSTSAGGNSTISVPTLSSGSPTSGPTGSTTGSSPPSNTNAAANVGSSPVALILGAVAAIAYLH